MKKDVQFTAYDSIYQDLKDKILSGVYKPNDRLPSVMELCDIYNASDSTIRKSLDMLKKNGYVYSTKRVGVFVSDHHGKRHSFQFHELENLEIVPERYEILSVEVRSPEEVTPHLSGRDKKYLRVERMYYNNALPVLYKIDYIAFNAKFDIIKSNPEKWLEDMGLVLDSYLIKKSLRIVLENSRDDIKDKMILPYHMGMFKIEKRYYTDRGAFAAISEIYVPSSDISIRFRLE
mgnify:CR=1 FL=1